MVFLKMKYFFSIRVPKVGETLRLKRKFNEDDVKLFAQISGDHNPLHLNKEAGY